MSVHCIIAQPSREANSIMSSRVTGPTPPASQTAPASQAEMSLAAASDDVLLDMIGSADRKAARRAGAELINRHLSYIVHICHRKLGNQAEAEEAAQDVFLSVWKMPKTGKAAMPKSPLGYIASPAIAALIFCAAANRPPILRRLPNRRMSAKILKPRKWKPTATASCAPRWTP